MGLLVAVFLVGYFLVWPAYVMPLVNASRPIGKQISLLKIEIFTRTSIKTEVGQNFNLGLHVR